MSGSTTLRDSIAMRGDLTIVVRGVKSGEILQTIEIRNKITFLAADVLVDLLAQRASDAAPAANRIFSMRMGSSSTAASRADTNLLGVTVIGKALGDVNKTTGVPGELKFVATIEAAEANGSTLQEAGLFTAGAAATPTAADAAGTLPSNPRMFARQTHPAISKTSGISLEYSWRVAFTA